MRVGLYRVWRRLCLMNEADLNRLTIPLRLNKAVAHSISNQQQADARSDGRRNPRFKLSPGKRITLEFERSDGRVSADGLLRDLSESGAGLWIGIFIHPETRCWLVLTSPNGDSVDVEGVVRWCKHFSQSVHEVGIQLYDANPDVLAATLAGHSSNLASDLADVLTMVHSTLADIRRCAENGMTPDQTKALIAKLEEVTGKK